MRDDKHIVTPDGTLYTQDPDRQGWTGSPIEPIGGKPMPIWVRPKRYKLQTFAFGKIFGKHIDEWTSAEQYERAIRLSMA